MYEPQVDDYVKWTTALGMVHEGWVYFKCDPTPKKRGFPKSEHYITIELGVKLKMAHRFRVSTDNQMTIITTISVFCVGHWLTITAGFNP